MTGSTLEGLTALLDKDPIIPTFKARDFLSGPADVDAAYQRHVRTYLPVAQAIEGEDVANVSAFEQKLIRLVRDARAPVGYISAEYGHGKTSTGLFLWERARAGEVLAVPPFSLDRLEDLIVAVAGWVRFSVERVRPGLGQEAERIFDRYRSEGLDSLAQRHAEQFARPYAEVLDEFRQLDQQGRLQTDADGLTFVNFLGEMAELAVQAGFRGLLVIADEVQQYIEHADVSSAVEPIGKLFDLITTMLSRTGRLACGLILLLPNKELGLLNQQRGDLVQRIKRDRLSLDLTQVYGPGFAAELWQLLSERFGFAAIAPQVFTAEALRALGEIAARTDLASGPRTVIDVFKIACERHQAGASAPFGLLDLVCAFEEGRVAFDGLSRIQLAVRQALASEFVRGHADRERAVRLMAAFPTSGLTEDLQEREGVHEAVGDLVRLAGGELVAIRGGGYDHLGRAVAAGVTLLSLRPAQEQVTWLKGTIRDFRRAYYLGSEAVHRLALQGFVDLVTDRLFPAPHWRVDRTIEATALSQNQGLALRGAFPGVVRRFPERVVYLRIQRPGETLREPQCPHDLLIDVALRVPVERGAEQQRTGAGTLTWIAANHARVELNLLHRADDASYLELNPGFEDIVAPYDVNPLLTLSLHAHLSIILRAGGVPGSEESNVRDLFLPALHSAALRDLLTAEIGRTASPAVAASDVRFFDALVESLCERTYGDQYVTLMVTATWQRALGEYRNALERIDNPYVQNGNEPYEAPKRDLAALLMRTNAALDNFIQSFPQLIKVETQFRGDTPGRVRFTLHPLEQRIVQLVQAGARVPRINQRTGQAMEVPTVAVASIQQALGAIGYRLEEVKNGLDLLQSRRMIEWDERSGSIALAQPDVPTLDAVEAGVLVLERRVAALRPLLGDASLRQLSADLARLTRALSNAERPPRANELLAAKRYTDQALRNLDQQLAVRRGELTSTANTLIANQFGFDELSRQLSVPPPAASFGGQLNAVRVAVLREVEAAAAQSDGLRAAAKAATGTLSRAGVGDAELAQAAEWLKQAAALADVVRERRDRLQRTVADYRAAALLLQQAEDLNNDRLAAQGDAGTDARAALIAWGADVTGQLSAHRVAALSEVGAWQTQLDGIRRKAAEAEEEQRAAFMTRQAALRAIVTDVFNVSADYVGATLTFNPADPEGSYVLLAGQFASAIGALQARFLQRLEQIASEARDQGRSERLGALPADRRTPAAAEMAAVERDVATLAAAVAASFRSLIDGASAEEPAVLHEHARAAATAVGDASLLFGRVQTLTRMLQAVALTPEEEQANALLRSLAENDTVDLAAFEARLRQALPNADAWTILRGLAQKSRARLQIRIIRDDSEAVRG